MHPDPAFDAAAAASGFTLDAPQRRVAVHLSALGARLRETPATVADAPSTEEPGSRAGAPRGLYLWGPAGRGKTWLLDVFVRTLPAGSARRIHFHGFFRELHESIQRNRAAAEEGEGMTAVRAAVDELVGEAALLHLEEFHVHDPGNAVLLVRLLEALAEKGVVLIASSNYAPAELFADPEFHSVFRPGRALLAEHLDVLALDNGVDYRLGDASGARTGFARGRWTVRAPNPEAAAGAGAEAGAGTGAATLADAAFRRPAPDEAVVLTVDGRGIRAERARDGRVWFTFAELLEQSTAAGDYLTLCGRFDTWVLDGVPDLAAASAGARQRFVDLIDVLSDLGIELNVIAATSREALAAMPNPPAGLPRTLSRLALLLPEGA